MAVTRGESRPTTVDQVEPESADPGLAAVVALSAGFLLVVLVLVVPGGTIGTFLRGALGYGFGWGSYLLPVVIGAFAAGSLRARFAKPYRMSRAERVGWLLTLLVVVTSLEALDNVSVPTWSAMRGGGWLGLTIWTNLVNGLGGPGAAVVTAVTGLVALVLVFELTVEEIWTGLLASARACAQACRFTLRWLAARARRHEMERLQSRPLSGVATDWDFRSHARSQAEASTDTSVTVAQASESEPGSSTSEWRLPPVSLLKAGSAGELSQVDLNKKIQTIEQTLADFDVYARVVQVNPGPTVTQFGLEPGFREKRDRNGEVIKREKIKVSEITALTNDLALALAAPSIRIEAPVPGRQVVGLEVPNGQATIITLRQIVESTAFQKLRAKTRLAIALGEDVSGQPVAADLTKMPHLLIAGATGSGKSVCINAIISCLLLQATPAEVRLILVDPKRVELTGYNDVPHLLRPVVVDVDKVVGVLKWVVHEMDERYKQFEAHGVRNIEGFNRLANGRSGLVSLPFIVVVIDELADLMMLAPDDTERLLCRLAQLARATGIHLIVATQRPSVDVITGLIKANFPTRISFAVTSQIDSRTILDTVGAEKLLGRGDMLFLPTDAAKPIRLQGVWVSEDEIEALVRHWRGFGPPRYVEQLVQATASDDDPETDELYAKAAELAHEHSRVSTSLLQRRLKIGYTRAARLIDLLEQNGVVGPAEGGGRSRPVGHGTNGE